MHDDADARREVQVEVEIGQLLRAMLSTPAIVPAPWSFASIGPCRRRLHAGHVCPELLERRGAASAAAGRGTPRERGCDGHPTRRRCGRRSRVRAQLPVEEIDSSMATIGSRSASPCSRSLAARSRPASMPAIERCVCADVFRSRGGVDELLAPPRYPARSTQFAVRAGHRRNTTLSAVQRREVDRGSARRARWRPSKSAAAQRRRERQPLPSSHTIQSLIWRRRSRHARGVGRRDELSRRQARIRRRRPDRGGPRPRSRPWTRARRPGWSADAGSPPPRGVAVHAGEQLLAPHRHAAAEVGITVSRDRKYEVSIVLELAAARRSRSASGTSGSFLKPKFSVDPPAVVAERLDLAALGRADPRHLVVHAP